MTDAATLERLILDAWPARERGALDGWTLLADAGVTGRVNAAAPLAFDGGDVEAAIDAASAWLGARGVRPCFKIADSACAPARLPETLAARGWAAHTETLVMTARIADALARIGAGDATLSADYTDAIDAVVRETAASPEEYAERSGIARRTPQPRRFAQVERDREAAAVGLSVITEGHAAIFLMRTAPTFRRQGLARAILATLLDWARREGAEHTYLQVEAANAPAIALYERAGFTTAYAYRYWRAPPAR
jgi:ribosomal protein S18 acetylase RimI-like enzyme